MSTAKNSPQSGNASLAPSFAAVAKLIAPENTPSWLKDYLENWVSSLVLDRDVSAMQPTKATMKRRMVAVAQAAALLDKELADTVTKEFLERAGLVRIENLGGFQRALQTIAERAKLAAGSSALSTTSGKTKSGQGKAMPPDSYRPKTFCALVIAEAWRFLHQEYPPPRNRGAAEAAQAYWLAAGCPPAVGWGSDPLNAWRPHFKKARGPEAAAERAECLRHLGLYKQHG
jgi:hypothetical protein